MRRLVCIAALVGLARVPLASADDAHAEMAEALAAAVDTHPGPAVLPVATPVVHLAQTPAAKHVSPRTVIAGRRSADQALQGQGQAAALAHGAQGAAMSAAGQAQAQAARERHAHHPHPGH
jgi:hypothetical protein